MAIARYGAFARSAPTPLPEAARQTLAELLGYRRQLLAEIAPAASNSAIGAPRP